MLILGFRRSNLVNTREEEGAVSAGGFNDRAGLAPCLGDRGLGSRTRSLPGPLSPRGPQPVLGTLRGRCA